MKTKTSLLLLFFIFLFRLTWAVQEFVDSGYPREPLTIFPNGPVRHIERKQYWNKDLITNVYWRYDLDGHLVELSYWKPSGWIGIWKAFFEWNSDGDVKIFRSSEGTLPAGKGGIHYRYDSSPIQRERVVLFRYRDDWGMPEIPLLQYWGSGNLVEEIHLTNQEELAWRSEYQWDVQGNLLEQNEFDHLGPVYRTVVHYNNRHQVLDKTIYFTAPYRYGDIREQEIHTYDDRGTETMVFYLGSALTFNWENRYDELGRILERIARNENSALRSHTKYLYSAEGLKITTQYFDILGGTSSYLREETFDTKGNLVRKIEPDWFQGQTRTVITTFFYDDQNRLMWREGRLDNQELFSQYEVIFDLKGRVVEEKTFDFFGKSWGSYRLSSHPPFYNESTHTTYKYDSYDNLTEKQIRISNDTFQDQLEKWIWQYTYSNAPVQDWEIH